MNNNLLEKTVAAQNFSFILRLLKHYFISYYGLRLVIPWLYYNIPLPSYILYLNNGVIMTPESQFLSPLSFCAGFRHTLI